MIDVVNVWHHYGIRPVLRNVSLRVATGEVVVVMGPNGMGKSTLLSVVAGLMSPLEGHVEIDGLRRRRSIEEERQLRHKVVYLPDTPWLPLANTGREFLLAVGRIYRIAEGRLLPHVEELLDLFDLLPLADSAMSSYSTGQRKKAGICSALVTQVPVLVLDEPFSGGLDSSALMVMTELLKRMAAKGDRTVLMAVPVPELVEGLADRIAIIKEGQIIACDSPAELRRQGGEAATLNQAIERLVRPEGMRKIEQYLAKG